MIPFLLTLFFLLGILLYFFSVKRFRKSVIFEILIFFLGSFLSLFFLFGTPVFSLESFQSLVNSVSQTPVSPVPEEGTPPVGLPPLTPATQPTPGTPVGTPPVIPSLPETVTQNKNGPQIEITYPADGQVFSADTQEIIVTANVTDPTDTDPIVEGLGTFSLQTGFNAIIVTAVNTAGIASHQFVIVEKK